MTHACGVIHEGKGILFAGESEKGKTTLARQLAQHSDVTLLSDDRVVLTLVRGEWRMVGTPFHGEGKFTSPESAPLKKIFFLEHSPENFQKPLTPRQAFQRLFQTTFPTFWLREGLVYSLDANAEVAQSIPACAFGFRPDRSAVDFILAR